MSTLAEPDINVKLLKEKARLEAKRPYRCLHGVDAPNTCDECKRRHNLSLLQPRKVPMPAEINRPIFYAVCLEPGCGWRGESYEDPHVARHAQNRAIAHRAATGHHTRSEWDIIGQVDEDYPVELEVGGES